MMACSLGCVFDFSFFLFICELGNLFYFGPSAICTICLPIVALLYSGELEKFTISWTRDLEAFRQLLHWLFCHVVV